jgi:hypothetical protein
LTNPELKTAVLYPDFKVSEGLNVSFVRSIISVSKQQNYGGSHENEEN